MKPEVDLLLISPGNNRAIYQDLAQEYAAVEPPIWGALLANFARKKGYGVTVLDQEAEGLSVEDIARRAGELRPRLTVIVVYGQQPSASTQNMTMAGEIAAFLHDHHPELVTLMLGGHPSSLPERSLRENAVDFVCQGEGPHTLEALLQLSDLRDPFLLQKVPGLWYRVEGRPVFTSPSKIIPEGEMVSTFPGMAWDLLPMDAYRAHNWHCFAHIHERKPYASIYTSLGCPFRCTFCCINAPFDTHTIRYWDPSFVITELDKLANTYGVKNIKIADEMFVLHERHVIKLCDLIIERGYNFNFWAYARVDTVQERFLDKLKRAGFNWLCLGIESGSKHVRDGVSKGRFKEDDIVAIVRRIQGAGINVIGNYIFGLPDDDYASMQNTFDLALTLNCEMANFYSGMAYPGSQLYSLAVEKGWPLPDKWVDFSQHSYEQRNLPTEKISAGEVLAFRDKAWQIYFTDPQFLGMLRTRFGQDVVDHIERLTKISLRRKYAAPLRVEPRGRQPTLASPSAA